MTAVAKQDNREVARPLKVLEKLILEDIEQGELAGKGFYKAAGEKLNEARDGYYDGDPQGFYVWATKKFGKSSAQIRTWMGFAAASSRKSFKSIAEYRRHKGDPGAAKSGRLSRGWTAPVDDIAERARNEARRLASQEEMTRAQERDAEAKLGLRLIDIGYRVLAKELHPDKGGSRDAMSRLGRVRDRLRSNV